MDFKLLKQLPVKREETLRYNSQRTINFTSLEYKNLYLKKHPPTLSGTEVQLKENF